MIGSSFEEALAVGEEWGFGWRRKSLADVAGWDRTEWRKPGLVGPMAQFIRNFFNSESSEYHEWSVLAFLIRAISSIRGQMAWASRRGAKTQRKKGRLSVPGASLFVSVLCVLLRLKIENAKKGYTTNRTIERAEVF